MALDTPEDGRPPNRLRREVLLVLMSVALSAPVAFGVARYTVNQEEHTQSVAAHRDARQRRLFAFYLPLSRAMSNVIACVNPELCSEQELLRANRASNNAAVAAIGQGSTPVDNATSALETSLGELVRNRLAGKQASGALLTRVARDFVALQQQISQELSP